MRPTEGLFSGPRWMAIVCAAGAIGLGLAYMLVAGAPLRYLAVNAGALVVGVGLACLMTIISRTGQHEDGRGTLALGALLLASSLFGVTVNGATRWITVAGFSLQPSLLLIPLMLVRFARRRNSWSTLGLVLACVAVALQPDRGMAGALVAGLLALAIVRRERLVLTALSVSLVGFAATLIQVDVQPAMPFVDQILFTSFEVHPLAGLGVLGGAALLLAPALIGRFGDAQTRHAQVVFGATWLAVIVAAALGNYPTPLVGYGGSAIIGYVLSSFALPEMAADDVTQRKEVQPDTARDARNPVGDPRFQRHLSERRVILVGHSGRFPRR